MEVATVDELVKLMVEEEFAGRRLKDATKALAAARIAEGSAHAEWGRCGMRRRQAFDASMAELRDAANRKFAALTEGNDAGRNEKQRGGRAGEGSQPTRGGR